MPIFAEKKGGDSEVKPRENVCNCVIDGMG